MACCSITTQYKLPNWFELFRSKLFNSSKTNSKYNDKITLLKDYYKIYNIDKIDNINGNIIKLKTQNSKLKTQNSKLKTQNSKLKTQNSLKNHSKLKK